MGTVKEPFVKNMKQVCDEIGMRFYVSDAHFKESCSNGSCCGLPESFNYSRGQWCQALMLAKKNGKVTYSEVKDDIEKYLSGFEFRHAQGFNTGGSDTRSKFYGMTMAEYMQWLWNNPNNGQSPYTLFEEFFIQKKLMRMVIWFIIISRTERLSHAVVVVADTIIERSR